MDIQSELLRIKNRVDDLDIAVSMSFEKKDSDSEYQNPSTSRSLIHHEAKKCIAEAPFTVFYNQGNDNLDEGCFYIYTPKGCISLDGEDIEFGESVNDDCMKVEGLSESETSEEGEFVYCHVRAVKKSGKNEVSIVFDTNEEASSGESEGGEEWEPGERRFDFIVGIFKESYTRVCSSRIELGCEEKKVAFAVVGCDGIWKVRYYDKCFTYNNFVPDAINPTPSNDLIDTGFSDKNLTIYGIAKIKRESSESGSSESGSSESGKGKVIKCSELKISDTESSAEDEFCFPIAHIKDGVVEQVVYGAIHVGGEGGESEIVPDEKSLSQDKGIEGEKKDSYFYIKGFGKFKDSDGKERGSFEDAKDFTLKDKDDDYSSQDDVSFLVREGNTSDVYDNKIGYRTLKFSSRFSPFYYSVKPKASSWTGELERLITNNIFYFDGKEEKIEEDYIPPLNGFVYLRAICNKQEEGSESKPTWEFSMGTEELPAPEGGRAINIKLYEFNAGKVVCDYRTTFLTLNSGDCSGVKLLPDEQSISRLDSSSEITGYTSIKGFGKFKDSDEVEHGSFLASEPLELGDEPASNMSFLVRTGDSDTVGGNSIGYRQIKIPKFKDATFSFLYDIRYDIETHQFQKQTREVTVTGKKVELGAISDWTMIEGGQAVPHSNEIHGNGE